MKVQRQNHEIERNIGGEQKFSIALTAKSYEILSSGLYSDKVSAVIREICCNAHDSHKEANQTKPFNVSLPNSLQTNFIVEDFGTGLSEENVLGLYTTLFQSTKENSNDFTGCLGLGSKTPFSLTDSFNVESRYNGKEYHFVAFLNEERIPAILKTGEFETDKENGLTINVPIAQKYFYDFKIKAINILQYFPIDSFNIKSDINIPHFTSDYNLFVKNFYCINNDRYIYNSNVSVKMGNVVYNLNLKEINQENRVFLNSLKTYIIIDIKMGECDVQASREELSYDSRTKNNLDKIINKIRKKIKRKIAGICKPQSTQKERYENIIKLKQKYNDNILKHLKINLEEYSTIPNFKFISYKEKRGKDMVSGQDVVIRTVPKQNSTPMFIPKRINDYHSKLHLEAIYSFRDRTTNIYKIRYKHIYDLNNGNKEIIIIDKSYCKNKKIEHIKKDSKEYIIIEANPIALNHGLDIDEMIKAFKVEWGLNSSVKITKLSDVVLPKVKRTYNKRKYIPKGFFKFNISHTSYVNYPNFNRQWDEVKKDDFSKIDFDDEKTLFVSLYRNDIENIKFSKILLLNFLGYTIYGVRPSGKSFFKKNNILNKIDKIVLNEILIQQAFDTYSMNDLLNYYIFQKVKDDRYKYSSNLKKCFNKTKLFYNVKTIVDAVNKYAKHNDNIYKIAKELNIKIENTDWYIFFEDNFKQNFDILEKFPMLKIINTYISRDEREIVKDYINNQIKMLGL